MSELSEAAKRHQEEKISKAVADGDIPGAIGMVFQGWNRPHTSVGLGLDELALASCRGVGHRGFWEVMEVYGSAAEFLAGGSDHQLWGGGGKRWPKVRVELGGYIARLRAKGYGPTGGDHG